MRPRGKDHSLTEFCSALRKHDRYLLSCHVTPEGDAIGSILAMDSLLRRLGKRTRVVCEDPFPERLKVCFNQKRWNALADVSRLADKFGALVVADCSTLDRIGKVKGRLNAGTVIFNIDHHVSNDRFGDYNYIRPEAAASGEVVMDIFKHMKVPITREDAVNLYIALATDTGSFKYSNTTVHSHRMAAELMMSGIDIEKINEQLYTTYSLNKLNLYSRLLGRVRTTAGGRIAWVGLTRTDLKHSGATYEDTEGFIDFLKYIREVKVAFFMSELPDGESVKVSFRSHGPYDVNKVATHFKGGGHKKASGCTVRLPLHETERQILNVVRRKFKFK